MMGEYWPLDLELIDKLLLPKWPLKSNLFRRNPLKGRKMSFSSLLCRMHGIRLFPENAKIWVFFQFIQIQTINEAKCSSKFAFGGGTKGGGREPERVMEKAEQKEGGEGENAEKKEGTEWGVEMATN